MADPNLTNLVAQAVESSGINDGGDGGSESVDVGGEAEATADAGEQTTEGEGEAPAQKVEGEAAPSLKAKVEEKKEEKSEVDKLLEAEGIQKPRDGQKEARIPYARVRKIVENNEKRVRESLTAELGGRATKAEGRIKELEATENIAMSDPDRYISILAAVRPDLYGKFATVLKGGAPQREEPKKQENTDPMPQPDTRFADGSVGYSLEGLQKRDEWNRRQILNDVRKELGEQFGKRIEPFEKQARDANLNHQTRQAVDAEMNEMKEVYGELLTDDLGADVYHPKADSEIVKVLQANPRMSLSQACSRVFTQRLRTDRNKMRTELMDEINKQPRPKTPGPAPAKPGPVTGERSLRDIVAERVQESGLA